jgi:hypothetical protein
LLCFGALRQIVLPSCLKFGSGGFEVRGGAVDALRRIEATTPAPLIDANMLVVTGGVERTKAEFAALLAAAGLRLERVISTAQAISVLEASQA